jgi:hypothetical protein
MPQGKRFGEADFLAEAHEKQMAAKTPEAALYYRMHKEMAPSIVRMVQEAVLSGDPEQATDIALAFAKFAASTSLAIGAMLGGATGTSEAENGRELGKTIMAAAQDFMDKWVEAGRHRDMLREQAVQDGDDQPKPK